MSHETTFRVGDSDLLLLGIAAAMTARSEAHRKDNVHLSDIDAQALLVAGFVIGMGVPLDDIPKVRVSIHATKEALQRMQALATTTEEET